MDQPLIVAGTFADLEYAVREICGQIDLLAQHVPEEEVRAYAELAKEDLWRMYQSAYQRALAREGLGRLTGRSRTYTDGPCCAIASARDKR